MAPARTAGRPRLKRHFFSFFGQGAAIKRRFNEGSVLKTYRSIINGFARRAVASAVGPLLGILALAPAAVGAAESSDFRVPENFEVSLYADDDLAHDIFSMTVDARGRIVVSGRGYIEILEDADRDGVADKAVLFSEFPKGGAYGLYAGATNIICVGDNAVWSLSDTDGDGRADGEPRALLKGTLQRGHSANGIVRGPDGWFYLACGNDAGINESHAVLPGSPVKRVNAGAIVRFSPDGRFSEVVADGLRNPYDLAFNPDGHLFTVDADGERDRHLPWYSPNRLFDIAPGMHHGWVLQGWIHAWNRPGYWPDVAPRLDEIGRGSPTGMLVYRHRSFPERYTRGVFSMCWTFGRIYFFPLEQEDSSYTAEREIFLETTGETGFAPVDMEIGPGGDMFVAIGGRGTRGGVFRVRYKDSLREQPGQDDLLRRVLGADQPLASWSRATWQPLTAALKRVDLEKAAAKAQLEITRRERFRALEILVDVYGGVTPRTAHDCLLTTEPELSARAVWALSRSLDQRLEPAAHQLFADATRHASPLVKRAAFEAIAALPNHMVQLNPEPDWFGGLNSQDRRVRAAAVLAARGPGLISFENVAKKAGNATTHRQRVGFLRVFGPFSGPDNFPSDQDWTAHFFKECVRIIRDAVTGETRLEAARLIQQALGDVKLVQDKANVGDGYIAAAPERIAPDLRRDTVDQLTEIFPTGHPAADRELLRALAMLNAGGARLLTRVAAQWSDGASLEDDIHLLLAAVRMPGERPDFFTIKSARALALLHHKMNHETRDTSRFWPARISDAYRELQAKDPGLADALIADPAFGLPEHSLFTGRMPEEKKVAGLRRILTRTLRPNPFKERRWTAGLVSALRDLPATEALPPLRRLWESEPALRDAIATTLSAHADPADRPRLVASLASLQAEVVERAAVALTGMEGKADDDELLAAFRSLRRQTLNRKETKTRAALAKLLQAWSGQAIEIKESDNPGVDYQPWFDWFTSERPEQAKRLAAGDGGKLQDWEKRLQGLTLTGGDAARGKTVFEQRGCAACHSGSSRLGPGLKGVAARFSPRDLFLAIVDPNRDVSPTYHTKTVTTKAGESYTGVMIYDSPAAKLIQTSADTTVRVTAAEFASESTSATSLMPVGLLEGLTDAQLADLYAYLRNAVGK